jgi:TRAP-type C4-dicarboxylate transport system substrate-binding protein
MVSHFLMSEAAVKKLPAEYMKIVEEISDEIATIFTEKGDEFDKQIMKELQEKYGVTVSEVNKEAFMAVFQPLHEELAAAGKNEELLKLLRDTRDALAK